MVSPVIIERRHDFGFMVSEEEAWRSRDEVTLLQQLAPNPPASASLSTASSGGTLSGTVYVRIAYVGAFGETAGSTEASVATTGSSATVTIASPSAVNGATGWMAYAATAAGQEVLQTPTPMAIGTNLTLTALGGSGAYAPDLSPGNILSAGTVLGKIAVGSSATYTANAGNTGNFTSGAISVTQGAMEGTYTIEFLSATAFNVFYPNGELVAEGHTGTAFAAGGLSFTITAGGTAAVAGDGATVALATNANAGLYAPLNLSAADGTQTAAVILGNETDASAGNTPVTVISRAAQVNGSELIYPAAASAAQIAAINAQLATTGIIVR